MQYAPARVRATRKYYLNMVLNMVTVMLRTILFISFIYVCTSTTRQYTCQEVKQSYSTVCSSCKSDTPFIQQVGKNYTCGEIKLLYRTVCGCSAPSTVNSTPFFKQAKAKITISRLNQERRRQLSAGGPNKYQITIKKIELCTSTSSTCECHGRVTIGAGVVVADIASVDAGQEVVSFVSATGLPIGTTFTHMRVTMDRKITTTTGYTVDGQEGDECVTRPPSLSIKDKSGPAYRPVVEQVEQANIAPVDEEDMDIYIINKEYTQCLNPNCTKNETWEWEYPATNDESTVCDGDGDDGDGEESPDFIKVYTLKRFGPTHDPLPYTVRPKAPKIGLLFGIRNSIGVSRICDNGPCVCSFFPGVVDVEAIITDSPHM